MYGIFGELRNSDIVARWNEFVNVESTLSLSTDSIPGRAGWLYGMTNVLVDKCSFCWADVLSGLV